MGCFLLDRFGRRRFGRGDCLFVGDRSRFFSGVGVAGSPLLGEKLCSRHWCAQPALGCSDSLSDGEQLCRGKGLDPRQSALGPLFPDRRAARPAQCNSRHRAVSDGPPRSSAAASHAITTSPLGRVPCLKLCAWVVLAPIASGVAHVAVAPPSGGPGGPLGRWPLVGCVPPRSLACQGARAHAGCACGHRLAGSFVVSAMRLLEGRGLGDPKSTRLRAPSGGSPMGYS